MAPTGAEPARRLAAVLLADVVGYSTLMERDDAGTHARLRDLRETVTDPAVIAQGGRIVRSRGDDLLAEFPSARQAFDCALAIQRALAQAAAAGVCAPGEAPLQLRIGLSLGDVLTDGDDIAGDGVNLAARLQPLAAPGGIALTAAVRDQLGERADAELIDAGSARLKNLARPVRWFHAYPAGAVRSRGVPGAAAAARRLLRRAAPALLALVLVGGLALAAWLFRQRPADAGAQTVAIAPTRSSVNHPATAALARDLDTALAAALTQGLGVGGRLLRADQTRGAGAARYLVVASVVAVAERSSVAIAVSRTRDGAAVWHATLHAPAGSNAAEELTAQAADPLLDRLRLADVDATGATAKQDPTVLTLRAQSTLPSGDPEQERAAIGLLQEALRRRPDYPPALATLAELRAHAANRAEEAGERDRLLADADELSQRAIARANDDAAIWRSRAQVLLLRGRTLAAAQAIERSLRLYPYSSVAHGTHGLILTSADRPEEALAAFARAVQLNPGSDSLGVHLYHRCRTEVLLGRYADAIESCRRSTAFTSDWIDYVALTAALQLAGRQEEASASVRELLRRQPGLTLQRLRMMSVPLGPRSEALREQTLHEGLRRAGLPER